MLLRKPMAAVVKPVLVLQKWGGGWEKPVSYMNILKIVELFLSVSPCTVYEGPVESRRALDPLEPEFQVVVAHHVGAGNQS